MESMPIRSKHVILALALAMAAAPTLAGTYEAPLDARGEGEAKFVAEPKAVKAGEAVNISFEVAAPTDVEVAVLGKDGKVVRHLAAGLLGKNAPAPLAKDALRQELTWDGRDDAGRPAAGGPFSFRVRLGTAFAFDKVLGWDGQSLGPIRGLAVGAGGELYVFIRSWVGQGRTELRVFDRAGKYLRTVMPYPASTPPERAKSVGQLEVDGQRLPVVFSGHAHALSPLTAGLPLQNPVWSPKGFLVAVSTLATAYEHGLPRHLLAFHPQGGAPEGMSFVGPLVRPPTGITWGHGEGDDPCFDHLAASPDGKWIYYSPSTFTSPHAIYRLAWGEDVGSGTEAGWFGEDNRPGSEEDRLNGPAGLAVDASGRVYICDRGNNRVMVVAPDAKPVGSFPVEDPEQIAVHPKSGEIYVFCRQAPPGNVPKDIGPLSMAEYRAWKAREAERKARRRPARPPKLLKFSAWGEEKPKELARLEQGVELMALDGEASPPRLWATIKGRVVPIEDRDGKLQLGEAIPAGDGLGHPGYVAADPERGRALLYNLSSNYKVDALDLKTGAKTRLLDSVSDFAIAPDGSIYGTGKFNSRELLRFSADGKPENFPGTDRNVVKISPFWVGGVNLGARGMAVSPAGDIYLMRASGEKAVQSRLDVFAPDGKVRKTALVDGLGIGDCGVGVDAAGNVYLGVNVKPKDRLFPEEFRGKVPGANWLCWAQWTWQYRPAPWEYSMRNEYLYHWGAVVKFGPEGGAFYGRGSTEYNARKDAAPAARAENAPEGATDYMSGYLYGQVKAVGVQWRYPGMGIVPSSERMWGDPSCVCMGSRLSVDPYGRVYMPNCFRFCVEVLDPAGNRIARVGRYGNVDDRGDEPRFAWPAFVSAAGDVMAVSDSVNRRVVTLRRTAAAEASCPAP